MLEPSENPEEIREFTASETEEGQRLDRVGAIRFPDLSRAALQSLVRSGRVEVNGAGISKPRRRLKAGDRVRARIPASGSVEPRPEAIPLAILFEDGDIVVVDKPAGLVVHPGAGNPGGTLVNALLHHCRGNLSRAGDSDRPGIVHRLDKETSGCLVAAKSETAYYRLVAQFSGRDVEKDYLCVVQGVPHPKTGRIENRIGRHPVSRQRMAVVEAPAGKEAVTDYELIEPDPGGTCSVVRCRIHTGRTHQIRVHMKECLRCPILGDEIYAQPKRQPVQTGRMMLHAWKLAIRHPASGDLLLFESPLPGEFEPFVSSRE